MDIGQEIFSELGYTVRRAIFEDNYGTMPFETIISIRNPVGWEISNEVLEAVIIPIKNDI